MPITIIFAIAASVFITAAISGTFGMAGGMIMMVVLLQLLPLTAAIFLHAAIQLVSNGWRCWLWRKYIVWRALPVYGLGMMAGFSVVVWTKFIPDKAMVLIMIGIVPLLALAVQKTMTLTIHNRIHAFFAALLLTFVHMTGGVVGALLDLLFNNTDLTRKEIVATKAFTQGSSHLMRLTYFGALVPLLTGGNAWPDGITAEAMVLFLAMAIVGTTSAAFILHRLDDRLFKQLSRWLIIAVSLYCLGRGVYMIYSNT